MVGSIRSGCSARLNPPARRWALRRAEALVVRSLVVFAALVAWLLFAIPAQAAEVEAEPEPAPQAEPAPAPAPESERVRDVVSDRIELSEPSWIPSIDLGFETFDYNADTTVVNHINPPSWQGEQNEAERQLMVRIGSELMGPTFESLPGRPRLFVQGGAHFQMLSSDKMFGEGDPFVQGEPERGLQQYRGFGAGSKVLPGDFEGQGSEISADFQNPSWYAGLGVAFSVPIASNLLLYVKPSVQYSLEKIDLSAGLTTVDEPIPRVDPDPCGPAPRPTPCTREFFLYRSRDSATTTDHSVGAGLELALVLFRSARPVRVSFYAQARFLWLVSDPTTTFADPAGVASYSVMRDDFGIKGGGGLRLSWVGFD